jgi:integrase
VVGGSNPPSPTNGSEHAGIDAIVSAFDEALQAPGSGRNGKDRSIQTVRTYVKVVRLYLRWAEVPTQKYVPLEAKKKLLVILECGEIDRMEQAARSERDRLIVRVLADSGLRIGELVGLRAGDIGSSERDRRYWLSIPTAKTDSGVRQVPLPPERWKRLKVFAAQNPRDEYVFMGSRRRADGQYDRLTAGGASQMIGLLAKDAGIRKRVYSHLFRHSYRLGGRPAGWRLPRPSAPGSSPGGGGSASCGILCRAEWEVQNWRLGVFTTGVAGKPRALDHTSEAGRESRLPPAWDLSYSDWQ